MGIKLSILPHQTECLERVCKVFEKADIKATDDLFANPVFEPDDIKSKVILVRYRRDLKEKKYPENCGQACRIASVLMSAWKPVQVRRIAIRGLCMS